MKQRAFLKIAAVIFGIVALLHLIRAIYEWPAQIGFFAVPVWLSWLAFVVAGALCLSAFRLLRKT